MKFEKFKEWEEIFEYVVPKNVSWEEWKKMKKEGMTPAKYHKKNPKSRFKVVHGHKKGEIGRALPRAGDLSYAEAIKMHAAIVMHESEISGYGKGGSKQGTHDIEKTTLEDARSYAENELHKFGRELSKEVTNFDKNYIELKEKAKEGFLKRKDMPVFDKEEINDFQWRLVKGKLDIHPPFAPSTNPDDLFPNGLSGDEAADFLERGWNDGSRSDDIVKVVKIEVKVEDLTPVQNQIWLSKCIPRLAKGGSEERKRWIEGTLFVTSNDNFIIDGHHRYATAMIIDPEMEVTCVSIDLPIMTLIELATSFTDAKGKERNESQNFNKQDI
jgi:hypothetical protein